MGMDVFGMRPRSTVGQYFRASVWWWHPLAEFIEERQPEIAARCSDWHSNSGAGLNDEDSKTLARLLREDLDSGYVANFASHREFLISEMPPTPCNFCQTTGIRKDEVGVKHGYHDKQLEPEQVIRYGREFGWCNACDGSGYEKPFAAWYKFDVETVAEFAAFLADCGGFEIR